MIVWLVVIVKFAHCDNSAPTNKPTINQVIDKLIVISAVSIHLSHFISFIILKVRRAGLDTG